MVDNSVHVELLGATTSLNYGVVNNSAPRVNMDASHLGQMMVLPLAEKNRISSGVDREYGKYTFMIKIPEHVGPVQILDIIPKYPRGGGRQNFALNSEVLIVYESKETHEIGSVEVKNFHFNHKEAGFHYVWTDTLKQLQIGDILAPGTILAHSPQLKENGDWHFGLDAYCIMGSFPSIVEDGIGVTEDFCRRAGSVGFGKRIVEWGLDMFPLNLYGDEKTYKPFPDLGQRIRDDGLVFALRRFQPGTYAATMSAKALMTPDHTFDELVFGVPGAIVEDIEVWHSHVPEHHRTPMGMEEQAKQYWQATQRYEERIKNCYFKQKTRHQGVAPLTPQMHTKVREAMLNDTNIVKGKPRTFRKETLGDWRIKLTFSHPLPLTISGKITDLAAAKGVVCEIIKNEDAPTDKFGTRADVVADGLSTLNRMNVSRLVTQYINALSDQIQREVIRLVDSRKRKEAWEYLYEYYQDVSPLMHVEFKKTLDHLNDTDPRLYQQAIDEQLDKVYKDGIHLIIPPNTPDLGSRLVKRLEDKYKLDYGPVTFRGINGKMITTVEPFIIGRVHIIRLDKTATGWSATTFAKRQHHGITAKLSNRDKYSENHRNQSTRIIGETEFRILNSKTCPGFSAVMVTFPNSPAMCAAATKTILTADTPSDIRELMDYQKMMRHGSRGLQYITSTLKCAGIEFAYVDETKYGDCYVEDRQIKRVTERGDVEEVGLEYVTI